MKGYLIPFSVLGYLAVSAAAVASQAPSTRRPALPSNLGKYVDQYPVELMKVPAVKSRLKVLLGKRYSDFVYSIDVQSPMKMDGDLLFANGCMAHACTVNEAAFVIDLKNKRIHAVLYEKDKPPMYFNEDKAPTPQILIDHVADLKAG
jgi:hypothetical protein